jgi:hypothetical protein
MLMCQLAWVVEKVLLVKVRERVLLKVVIMTLAQMVMGGVRVVVLAKEPKVQKDLMVKDRVKVRVKDRVKDPERVVEIKIWMI